VKETLSISSLRDIDYNVVLARLMRRQNISVMVRAVQTACSVFTIACVVLLFVIVIRDFLAKLGLDSELERRVSQLTKQMSGTSPQSLSGSKDWDILAQRKPFGPLGRPSAAAPSVATPPPSPLMLALIGTFITAGQEPYAIIEDKKKQSQEMFLLNQSVFDQATLKKIYQDRVEVERNGRLETLRLDELGGGPSPSNAPDGDEFVVEEAELDKGLENLPLLLTQARAVPYFKDGRSIGLRLFAIKTGSLYEKVGLKNGDILKTINGNNLGDISQALKLFEQLKQERSINLVLEREKQDREFKYTIR